MVPLVIALLLAVWFTWLVARSVRAGWGKPMFWLAWFLLGACAVLSVAVPTSAVDRFLAQCWAYSLIGLPVWWAITAMRRRNGSHR
jgi:hypothetical protein